MELITFWLKWLGRFVSIAISLISGIIGVMGQIILTFSENPNPIFQKQVFWLTVFSAFSISSIISWLIEHNHVKELEKKIAEMYSKLLIEVQEISFDTGISDNAYQLVILFTVTNTKPENNSIKKCEFVVDLGDRQTEGECKSSHQHYPDFLQGKPTRYLQIFNFYTKDCFDKSVDELANKPYLIRLIDSYDVIHEVSGKTPPDLVDKVFEKKSPLLSYEKQRLIELLKDD